MRVQPRRLCYNVTIGTGANDFKIKTRGKKGFAYGVSKRKKLAIGFTHIADFSFRSIKNDRKLPW